jgi:hypothetical protein
MTKSIQSHQNNTLNINATPFLDAWKSTILAQAKLLGITVEPASSLDFRAISATIEEHLLQQNSSVKTTPVKHLQRIADTSNDFATVLTAQEQLYLQKAKFYNIELDGDQWCAISDLHMFDAVDSWEKKLKEALYLGVNWRMSDYDPEGLENAIHYKEEELQEDARQMRIQADAYYYSSRGC